jgi:hypothetical protein
MDDTYHSPSGAEWALLHKLLEKDFLGRDRLLVQLDGLLVKTIDKEGSFSIMINPLAAPAEVKDRVVAEAYYSDADPGSNEGPQVHVLLHVVKGKLAEIEVYKDDGSPIRKPPRADNLIFY